MFVSNLICGSNNFKSLTNKHMTARLAGGECDPEGQVTGPYSRVVDTGDGAVRVDKRAPGIFPPPNGRWAEKQPGEAVALVPPATVTESLRGHPRINASNGTISRALQTLINFALRETMADFKNDPDLKSAYGVGRRRGYVEGLTDRALKEQVSARIEAAMGELLVKIMTQVDSTISTLKHDVAEIIRNALTNGGHDVGNEIEGIEEK